MSCECYVVLLDTTATLDGSKDNDALADLREMHSAEFSGGHTEAK